MAEMTPATFERLTRELEAIETTALPAAEDDVARAQGVGDIAENPDVRLALKEVARLRARRDQVREALRDAVVTETGESDVVAVGVLVTLRFEGDDETETFLFGGAEERHERHTTLSRQSPIGAAVEGRRAGERVTVSLGGRETSVEVVGLEAA